MIEKGLLQRNSRRLWRGRSERLIVLRAKCVLRTEGFDWLRSSGRIESSRKIQQDEVGKRLPCRAEAKLRRICQLRQPRKLSGKCLGRLYVNYQPPRIRENKMPAENRGSFALRSLPAVAGELPPKYSKK
jgi:hypothetical protein